jgi:hypothetical protein
MRCGAIAVLVVVVEGVVVVGEIVDAELLTVGVAREVVGVLSDVVGGTVEETVVGVLGVAGRVTAAGTSMVVVEARVLVVVGGVVRGGAVSVTVELPPPSTPTPVVPSPWPRVLVMTEPSGRMMMRPSVPPGLIQMRCSSTVTSTGPVPGMAMVWISAPAELRTIIWRVRSLRR